MLLDMSLIHNKNRNEPNVDPWATPIFILRREE